MFRLIRNGCSRSSGIAVQVETEYADGFGLPVFFEITGGQVHDSSAADEVLANTPVFEYVIADKGYDKEVLRQQIAGRGSIPMIPRRCNSTVGNGDMDWSLYKNRHLVENCFARLKQYRALATRYDKLKRNFESSVAIACAIQWLPM